MATSATSAPKTTAVPAVCQNGKPFASTTDAGYAACSAACKPGACCSLATSDKLCDDMTNCKDYGDCKVLAVDGDGESYGTCVTAKCPLSQPWGMVNREWTKWTGAPGEFDDPAVKAAVVKQV